MISWDNILECFENSEYQILKAVNGAQEFWSHSTLYKGMSADDESVLYLVHSSTFTKVHFRNKVSVVILKDDDTNIPSLLDDDIGNALYVFEPSDAPTGIMQLNTRFQEQFKVEHILSVLQGAIAKGKGLQSIVETISVFFKAPVAILDTAFRYIAKSKSHVPDVDNTEHPEFVMSEKFDEKMLQVVRKSGALHNLIYSNEPFSSIGKDETVYFSPITIGSMKAAYLIIVCEGQDNDLSALDKTYLPLFASMICLELSKSNYYLFNKGSYYNYIFSMILSSEEPSIEDIRMRLGIYQYELRSHLYFLQVDIAVLNYSQQNKDRMAETLVGLFSNSFYIFVEDKLFFLISRGTRELITEKETESWEQALEAQNLTVAFTGPFSDFNDVQQHIRKTDLLLKIKLDQRAGRRVLFYDDFQAQAMIAALQEQEDISLFLYQPVRELAAYDAAHNTELINTLVEFLRHPKNITEICASLHIHKNTLYKRLEKIEHIMQCDFRNGEIIMRIVLTLEIMKAAAQ